MAATVSKNCIACNIGFDIYISEHVRGHGQYCSQKCRLKHKSKKILKNCLICGGSFETRPTTISRKESVYCSKKCAASRYVDILNDCLECGTRFKVFESNIKRGNGRFCSKSCAVKYRHKVDPYFITKATPEERFYKKIEYTQDCWLWTGLKSKGGYGRIRIENKDKTAHRYSWEIHFGEIPDGILVCHRCDNPPCVNPDHLFLGDHSDNAKDMVSKGRNRDDRGSKHPMAKLNEEIVLLIRKRLNDGERAMNLSTEYSVSPTTISSIKNKKTWRLINGNT